MSELKNYKTVLIIGIAGALAQITARLMLKEFPWLKIIGIDSRTINNIEANENLELISFKYTRGNFENLFRDKYFDLVIHLGRISHTSSNPNKIIAERLDLNLMGSQRILDLSLHFNVKKIIVLSTFHVYGAINDNPVFLKEDAVLRASIKYPELRDVVEMDQICTNWMWKNQNTISTIVLRPCNIIGAQVKNAMSKYLTYEYAPIPFDYNPIFQFIHEFDMANIIIQCADKVPTGIYNVAPDDFISIRDAFKHLNVKGVPVSMLLLGIVAGIVKKSGRSLPDYLIDYLKYSCLIDNSELKKYLGDNFYRFSVRESLDQLKLV
ncbi:MAG: NAD-dependent epimerase/dehydratase family protein [Bacteriovoracaceae bacterium]